MRKYYHIYPTCPSCYAPHTNPSPVEVKRDGIFRCLNCGTIFRGEIIFDRDKFPITLQMLGKYKDQNIPVVWGVNFNSIEKSYIRWLSHASAGVYYITWPWNRVKFIPALINEYILKKSQRNKGRILIISNIIDSQREGIYGPPDLVSAFKTMLYIQNFSTNMSRNRDIKKEKNRFNVKKALGMKSTVITYIIKIKGTSERREGICPDSGLLKCKHLIQKEFECDPIHSIRLVETRKKNGKKVDDIINKDGDVDVILGEREEYPNIHYRKDWLWEILENQNNLFRPFSKNVNDENNVKKVTFQTSGWNVVVWNNIGIERLLRTYNFKTTDLVIFDNFDAGARMSTVSVPNIIKKFIDISKKNSMVFLLFSTEPHNRARYWKDVLNIKGLVFHTWDNPPVIDAVQKEWKESKYPSPLSSMLGEAGISKVNIDIEVIFRRIDFTLDINGIIKHCRDRNVSSTLLEYIRKYLFKLKESPLSPLASDEYSFSVSGINAIMIKNYMTESGCDSEILNNKLNYLRKSDLITGKVEISPLGKLMLEESLKILESDNNAQILHIVNWPDYEKWKKIVREIFRRFGKRIQVMTWNIFFSKFMWHPDLIIISTVLPYHQMMNIYKMNIKKLIFAGYEDTLGHIERTWRRKMISPWSHPLVLKSDDSPEYFKDILKSISGLDKDISEDLEVIEEDILINLSLPSGKETSTGDTYHDSALQKGNRAYLLKLDGEYMIIPQNRSILIREKNGAIREVRLSSRDISSTKNKLRGKDLLLDPRGMYLSFKRIFLEYMFRYGADIVFESKIYRWDGFQKIYFTSILWILLLRKAIDEISDKENIRFREASKKLAEMLAQSDITASDQGYIEHWWRHGEYMEINDLKIPFFSVEHPQSPRDVIIIFRIISQHVFGSKKKIIVGDTVINENKMIESYVAARYIQRMRNDVFKGKLSGWGYSVKMLIQNMRRYISTLAENTVIKRIHAVYLVEIEKETAPFSKLADYHGICRIIN